LPSVILVFSGPLLSTFRQRRNQPNVKKKQKKTVDSPADMCWAENEDYFECIHGFKEKQRKLQIIEERQRREKLGAKFDIS